jgi:hypothetical protein
MGLKDSLFLVCLKHMKTIPAMHHTVRMLVFVLGFFVVLFGHTQFVHNKNENQGGGCT